MIALFSKYGFKMEIFFLKHLISLHIHQLPIILLRTVTYAGIFVFHIKIFLLFYIINPGYGTLYFNKN